MNPSNPSSPRSGAFALVAGADFSVGSDAAVDQAARIASRIPGGALHVVQVVAPDTDDARIRLIVGELESYVSEMSAALGIRLERVAFHVRAGDAAREIASLAAEVGADLVVLGSRRVPHLKSLFLGSVASRVVELAACPVMVASKKPEAAEARDQEPAIEPPCKDCVSTRTASAGAAWWCAQHATRHVHGHAYRYRRELPYGQHDTAVLPTGTGDPSLGGV